MWCPVQAVALTCRALDSRLSPSSSEAYGLFLDAIALLHLGGPWAGLTLTAHVWAATFWPIGLPGLLPGFGLALPVLSSSASLCVVDRFWRLRLNIFGTQHVHDEYLCWWEPRENWHAAGRDFALGACTVGNSWRVG